MKILKNKIIAVILVVCVMLSGCASYDETENEYYNNEISIEGLKQAVKKEADASLISSNVCVIEKNTPDSVDSSIKAPVALLINRTTNTPLFVKQPFKKMYPASITKVATTLMAFNKFNDLKSQTVTISKKAASITEAGAKLCGFREGDTLNFLDLVTATMVYSGNDAAYAVAEHVAGTEKDFCEKMSDVAHALGASATNFMNPHGLHNDRHFATAYDIYLIFNKMLQYPETYKIAGLSSVTVNYTSKDGVSKKKTFDTTNRYLTGASKPPTGVKVLAGKTGTTNKAGSCLVLLSVDTIGNEYISVILDADSSTGLYSDMTKLLGYITVEQQNIQQSNNDQQINNGQTNTSADVENNINSNN